MNLNSTRAWLPSQKGLRWDAPHRHSVARSAAVTFDHEVGVKRERTVFTHADDIDRRR